MHSDIVTKEKIVGDFRNLGIGRGDNIALGVSYKSIGKVIGGPSGFVETLLDVVGPDGTILIPTFTKMYPISLVRRHLVPVFIKNETPSNDGIISELIRTNPRAIRSRHPTNSYSSIGFKAEYLLADHDSEKGSYSPYSRLAEIKGKILIIGINHNFVGIRHEAQNKAGLLSIVPPRFGALYLDEHNSVKVFVRRDLGGCVKRLPEMINDMQQAHIVTEGFVGHAKTVVAPARECLQLMTNLLVNSPENYLCDAPSCAWCRYIEKHLRLIPQIADKRWFHKYPILRYFLDKYNYFQINDVATLTVSRYYAIRIVKKLFQDAYVT
jgi:aminoglycoside 3-N-acetyltransferase